MEVGYVFYENKYTEVANFCNGKGNLTIEEIEADKNGRRFKIVEVVYSEAEIASIELQELEKWFEEYDKQCIQYQRSLRLGIEFDKDIAELDNQAVENANRIKELRQLLS